jgi:hypothetical protein
MTGARILTDTGGEPLAILCKATGIKREVFVQFWKALRRPYADAENPTSPLGRALLVYDTIATAKAQTVLRYWNWSLSTERASANLDPDDDSLEFSPASRAAALVLNRRG